MNPFITSPAGFHLQLEDLEAQITQLTEQILGLPEGSASIYMYKGKRRMEGIIDGQRTYFSQKDLPLVRDLILRKYLIKKREELLHVKDVLDSHMIFENRYQGLAEQYLMDNPLRLELIRDVFEVQDLSLRQWANAPDQRAAPYQEERTEEALPGLFVRSKSEVMIVIYLTERGIPFRYEEPLWINGTMYCPDFTLRDPKTGSFYWYEHFGKMDDPKYVRDSIPKLIKYADSGIIPSVNLIMTFKTKKHQLSFPQIHAAVESVM